MNLDTEDVQLPIKKEWVKPELLNEEVGNTEGGPYQSNFENSWSAGWGYHS